MASHGHSISWLLCLAIFFFSSCLLELAGAANPTDGFTAVSLAESDFVLQSPYDVPRERRCKFDGTVMQLWVLSTDKPFRRNSRTKPRTEISLMGHKYNSGVWQFEADVFVPSGTTGVSIMQVFGAGEHNTTLMLHVYDGHLKYYSQKLVEDNIYDRWFRLNVVHNVSASSLAVFVDGAEKLRVKGRGGNKHYFKFGVYTQKNSSSCMESHWKNVRILKKNRVRCCDTAGESKEA